MSPIDPRRIARLEEAVRALHQQVNVLISEVRTLSAQAEAEADVRDVQDGAVLPPSLTPLAPPALPPFVVQRPASPAEPLPPPPVPPRPASATPAAPDAPAAAPRPWAAPLGGGPEEASGAPRGVAPPRAPGGAGRVPPPPPRPPRPAAGTPRPAGAAFSMSAPRGMSFETLVGRYGMLGGGALLILMGVGTFISWAIANNVITPVGRVGLGALAAAIFVAVGFHFRGKGEKKFGNVLLAMGLAITHTVAWGAGPKLHIIPPKLALGLAALASVLVAALALADEDETLYVVGIGGALLAPFVTHSGRANTPLMLTYGWIVITAGMFAMRGHRWKTAMRLMTWAGPLYCGVGLVGATFADIGDRMAPPFFALACAWSAYLLAAEEYRTTLVRAYMATMTAALFAAAASVASLRPVDVTILGVMGTGSLYFMQRPLGRSPEDWLLDAVVLPLGMLGAALMANGGIDAPDGVKITLVWGAVAASAALINEQDRRGPHYMVFGLTTLVCVGYLLRHDTLALGFALAAHAAGLTFLMRKERAQLVAFPAGIGLVVALMQARDVLAARAPYVSDPFVNSGAVLLLFTLLAWGAFFHVLATTRFGGSEPDPAWATISRVFIPVALFCWGWYELRSTVSYDVAISLTTLYFAVVGVGAIHYGRSREVPPVRHTGLGLCVVAAAHAIVRVWNIQSMGIKAGTMILVGLFMLGIVYWYRRAED